MKFKINFYKIKENFCKYVFTKFLLKLQGKTE